MSATWTCDMCHEVVESGDLHYHTTEPKPIDLMKVLTDSLARREDAGAGHHAPHAKRYDLTVEDGLSCIEPKGNGHYVDFDDYEALRRQYDATAEGYRAALSTAEREREADARTLREMADEMPHYADYETLHQIANRLSPSTAMSRNEATGVYVTARVPSGGETRTPESHE